MKGLYDEYYKIIFYAIVTVIFAISIYIIVLNIHHYQALSYPITVSEADLDYSNYKENINNIEYNLKKNVNHKSYSSLNSTLTILKNGGVFRLIPKSKLTYRDLYELNDYFINDLINNCWFQKLKSLNKNELNDAMITILINNSEYLNNHFIDNGLTLYDSYNENRIYDDYHVILKNYLAFSNIIISMSGG